MESIKSIEKNNNWFALGRLWHAKCVPQAFCYSFVCVGGWFGAVVWLWFAMFFGVVALDLAELCCCVTRCRKQRLFFPSKKDVVFIK